MVVTNEVAEEHSSAGRRVRVMTSIKVTAPTNAKKLPAEFQFLFPLSDTIRPVQLE